MSIRIPFLQKKFITKDINGESLRFYTTSVGVLPNLRGVLEPMARAISAYLNQTKDTGIERRYMSGPAENGDGFTQTEVIQQAINPDLAKIRHEQLRGVISEVIGVLEVHNLTFLGLVILDSLRDLYPNPTLQQAEEFIDQLDLPTMVDLLTGVWEANRSISGGPFGQSLRSLLQKFRDAAESESGLPKEEKTGGPTSTPRSSSSVSAPALGSIPAPSISPASPPSTPS